jgi:cytosine/adenosine deaminase-related metal-dependent hydrolase
LRAAIDGLGGMFNAHLHLDRSGTLDHGIEPGLDSDLADLSCISLRKKHSLIPRIHASSAYDPENLDPRVSFYVDSMISAGTTRADTLVDVTTDRVGLSALKVFLDIKKRRAPSFEFGVGAYTPLGFRDSEPERWDLLLEGAAMADFIGSLPERDDRQDYPEHIGFHEHCVRILRLGQELHKSIHIHVDQRNDPAEGASELVLKAVEEVGVANSVGGEPMVWLIHVISPSTYEEERFQKLVDGLLRHNIGVICCPSAAISMRQLRPVHTPTFNCIARVLEMAAAGLHIRIGSDNICDITSPAGTTDLMAEIFLLSNAIRFYDIGILAKMAAGVRLDAKDREIIRRHLAHDVEEVARVTAKFKR